MEGLSTINVGIVEDDETVTAYLKRAFEDVDPNRINVRFQLFATDEVCTAERWAENDLIDIFIVDLNLPRPPLKREISWEVGRDFVRYIHKVSSAGIIVYTSESLGAIANELLAIGADDFIRKSEVTNEFGNKILDMQSYLRAKILSVWRRTKYSRPALKTLASHADRKFKIGRWKFEVSSRWLVDEKEKMKLTANEHAILRHLCISETKSIDHAEFLAFVLGQTSEAPDVRLKNIIYRLRKKLGPSAGLLHADATYRLVSVAEL